MNANSAAASVPGAALGAAPAAGQEAPRTVSVAEALALASEQYQAGRPGEVETLCLKVLEVEPENPEALHLLGILAHAAGKHGVALALLEKAIRMQSKDARYHYNLGVVLGVLRRTQEALERYREAAALDPMHPNALGNLGNVALELDLHDEAIAAYDALLARRPDDPTVALARAIALYSARRFDLSGPAFERAVSLAPTDGRHLWEYAHHLLLTGDLANGWDAYEARFSAGNANVWCYPYPFPRWQGEPLAGKTLLIHGEQGLGDEIMFASIHPELIAEAAQVIICCQPHLAALFRDSFPTARVEVQLRADQDAWTRRPADWLAAAPRIDYQAPFGSLGRWRRRALADFPAHAGYLRANPAKTQAWAQKLADLPHPRVGLCWAANPAVEDVMAARRSRKKSLTLAQLEPLLIEGVSYVSLQTWEAAKQVAAATPGTRERILDASGGLGDFSDTAALIMNLDLVITVDTSVAHLAGALGKPVWVLLPWHADWRWHDGRDDNEWYPGARLYRQPALNDWESVTRKVRAELEAWRAQSAAPRAASPASAAGASRASRAARASA